MVDSQKKVDLVIAIDTSASMADEAQALSAALSAAIAEAKQACPSDLEVRFLGIEGTFAGTEFSQTVHQYLSGLGVAPDALKGRVQGSVPNAGAQEDVARTVEDLAGGYNWRPGAERNLFVLGDESLEGGDMVLSADKIRACDSAITSALRNGVKVHTYLGTPWPDNPYPTPDDETAMIKEYRRLALRTGGEDFIYTRGVANFAEVLKQTICASRISQPESIAGKQQEADKLDGKPSAGSTNICEQAGEIVRAVNTLADVLNKLVDACGPGAGNGKPCACQHHHNDTPQPSPAPAPAPAQPDPCPTPAPAPAPTPAPAPAPAPAPKPKPAPLALGQYEVNGWQTGSFNPTTAYQGAGFLRQVTGAQGKVTWRSDNPNVSVDDKGYVTINGPWDKTVTITATDEAGATGQYTLAPLKRWYEQDGGRAHTFKSAAEFCTANGLTMPDQTAFTLGRGVRKEGSLTSEWGKLYDLNWPKVTGGKSFGHESEEVFLNETPNGRFVGNITDGNIFTQPKAVQVGALGYRVIT